MGRPPSGPDEFLDWKQRLESHKASGLRLDVFCLQEGISKSTYDRWLDRLEDGIPESLAVEEAARQRAESNPATFLPVSLKASPIELQLLNGGMVRLPLTIGQPAVVEVTQVVGGLRPCR
jgi:hypothetical protein